MKGKTYGYIRVSSSEQNEDRQLMAMEKYAIEKNNIYMDKQSGKDFHRPQYRAMLRRLRPGDLVCITSIDRLGRNYEENPETVAYPYQGNERGHSCPEYASARYQTKQGPSRHLHS